MAGLIYEVNIPLNALTAATPTVVGFINAPTNQRVKVKAYGFFFDGTTNSATPVEIKLARPVTGTFNTGVVVGVPTEQGLPETIQSQVGLGASVQPTLTPSLVYKTITVHPQLGYEYIARRRGADQRWPNLGRLRERTGRREHSWLFPRRRVRSHSRHGRTSDKTRVRESPCSIWLCCFIRVSSVFDPWLESSGFPVP
jgi:hypothetical protein